MYDFYFTDKKKIKRDPEKFLILVKRLLPRWANGIPDSECIAIYKLLVNLQKKNKKKIGIIGDRIWSKLFSDVFLLCTMGR